MLSTMPRTKIARQPRVSLSTPPSVGPKASPTKTALTEMPSMRPLTCGAKYKSMRGTLAAKTIAAEMPVKKRKATSR